MANSLFFVIGIFSFSTIVAQDKIVASGTVLEYQEKKPLENVVISIEGNQVSIQSDNEGGFSISLPPNGDYIINVSLGDYVVKRIPISIENTPLNLGTIYLERDITVEQADNLITLTESEVFDDGISSNSSGLLQATRDIFLNRAAFDFGQAFFRVRGYDSQYGRVLVNGITMNKFYDGRPQ